MDVLLQNSKTAHYLKRDLSWTAQREEAFIFLSSGEAIDFAYAHRLDEVQVVLFFRELKHSIIVPFQADRHFPAHASPAKVKADLPQAL